MPEQEASHGLGRRRVSARGARERGEVGQYSRRHGRGANGHEHHPRQGARYLQRCAVSRATESATGGHAVPPTTGENKMTGRQPQRRDPAEPPPLPPEEEPQPAPKPDNGEDDGDDDGED